MYERTQKYEISKKSRLKQKTKERDYRELKELKEKPMINKVSSKLAGKKALNDYRASFHGSDNSSLIDLDSYNVFTRGLTPPTSKFERFYQEGRAKEQRMKKLKENV